MGISRKKYIIVLVLFALSALVVNDLSYDTFGRAEEGFEAIGKIPYSIGGWKGEELSLDSSVYEILETKAIIHRTYTLHNKNILLSIVYYPETKVSFHAPELCLGGKGNRIQSSAKKIHIDYNGDTVNLDINMIVQEKSEDRQLVYYFYKAGPFIANSYIKLRFAMTLSKFTERKKSGALIRVSTPIIQDNQEEASQKLIKFIEEIYPYIINYL